MNEYERNGNDNGRIEGAFESLDTGHIVEKFNYGKDTVTENYSEIKEETTEDGEY